MSTGKIGSRCFEERTETGTIQEAGRVGECILFTLQVKVIIGTVKDPGIKGSSKVTASQFEGDIGQLTVHSFHPRFASLGSGRAGGTSVSRHACQN